MWLSGSGEGLKKIINQLPNRRRISVPKRTPGVGYGLPDILAYYASAGLKKSEQKRLNKFLQNMRSKTSADRDLKEELSLEFKNIHGRKSK